MEDMRTTLSLDDDIVPEVKRYAVSRRLALGKAASELIRRGLQSPLQTSLVNSFHVVKLPDTTPQITTEHILKLQEDLG